MKKILLFIVLPLLVFQSFGKDIPVEKAKEIAAKFLQQTSSSGLKSAVSYNLVYLGDVTSRSKPVTGSLKSATNESLKVYFFGLTDTAGFILVSADDAAIPVLGYSYTARIKKDNLPTNFQKWVEGYKQQIGYLQANSIKPTPSIARQWSGEEVALKSVGASVSPLVSTQWDQAPYVNDKCPYDSDYRERTVTGCPATAMAQIMRYWKYPSQGVGFHSFQHDKYGTLSANFGSTTYNWDGMPNVINSANDAVATLMYHCGVAVEMSYNVAEEGGSGSYVIIDPYNRYPQTQTVEYALKTYFGYDPSLKGLERDNYSDSEWKAIIKAELDAGRPVQYAGYGQGGHTFVCDGYDNNSYFHINWGWGGYYDGYFLLDALNPGSGGIGAGGASYNDNQQALIGIKPLGESNPENPIQTSELQLYDDVTTSSYSITYTTGFTVHTDILNSGSSTFSGDYCAAVFDKNDAFIDFVEIISGASLQSNYHYTNGITFTSEGLVSMLPGSYNIYIFARPTDGEWVCLNADPQDYQTQSFAPIDVVYENDISLYSGINVLTEDIYTGGPLSLNVKIANYSYEDFYGTFDASLYDYNGEFVATIAEITNESLYSNYYNEFTFSTKTLDVEPGTYYLALMHQWNGYDYELTGSTTDYINPVKIIVMEQPVIKDIYENNDYVENAYDFDVSYTNNSGHVVTSGSNIHVGNDWDFYTVDLPAGYTYTVDARLHDAYNSGNGKQYSVDCLFLYSTDGGENWSDVYDDVMPSAFTVGGGKKLYFVVSPYFLGEKGTYLLDFTLQRKAGNGIDAVEQQEHFAVYPNPCVDRLTISSADQINTFQLYDLQGKLIREEALNAAMPVIDISGMVKGTYLVKAASANKTYTEKIVKQ